MNQVVVSEVLYIYIKLTTSVRSYGLKGKPEVVKQVDVELVYIGFFFLRNCRVPLRLQELLVSRLSSRLSEEVSICKG